MKKFDLALHMSANDSGETTRYSGDVIIRRKKVLLHYEKVSDMELGDVCSVIALAVAGYCKDKLGYAGRKGLYGDVRDTLLDKLNPIYNRITIGVDLRYLKPETVVKHHV